MGDVRQGPRIASTVDASATSTKSQSVTSYIRPVRVGVNEVTDAHALALHLTRVQDSLAEVTQATRSHPIQAPVTFKGLYCPGGGLKVQIAHNLGHLANWIVVSWKGAGVVNGQSLVSDEADATNSLTDVNNLYLRSYAPGTASIMVF